MFLLFIFFGALLVLILIAMNENGQLHNPPAEELAKYEAIKAEEDRRRMGLDGRNGGCEAYNPFDDPTIISGFHMSAIADIFRTEWDD
ncbi:hypothetical protein [Thiolapillus sp.]|uniref:hypothetical protein n=1 Tax=Thiolapillus sp. TaxID=2017437 RepID=UPI003AF4B9D6